MNNAYVMNTCQRFVIIHNSLICKIAYDVSYISFLVGFLVGQTQLHSIRNGFCECYSFETLSEVSKWLYIAAENIQKQRNVSYV